MAFNMPIQGIGSNDISDLSFDRNKSISILSYAALEKLMGSANLQFSYDTRFNIYDLFSKNQLDQPEIDIVTEFVSTTKKNIDFLYFALNTGLAVFKFENDGGATRVLARITMIVRAYNQFIDEIIIKFPELERNSDCYYYSPQNYC